MATAENSPEKAQEFSRGVRVVISSFLLVPTFYLIFVRAPAILESSGGATRRDEVWIFSP